jgi:hypothetical protein
MTWNDDIARLDRGIARNEYSHDVLIPIYEDINSSITVPPTLVVPEPSLVPLLILVVLFRR